jgi:hypothetical protein
MEMLKLVRHGLLALVGMVTLLSGCGDSQGSFLTNAPGTRSSGEVYGRVLLERSAAGASVQVTDLAGNSLGGGTVDSTGNFRVAVASETLPSEFRVKVDMPAGSSWDLPLLANVDRDGAAFCNVLTTAAALYRDRNGGSQEAAEAWVRRTFAIPQGVLLGSGVDESTRSFFRHSLFLDRARSRGGVSAYLSSLIESGQVSPQFGEVAGAIALSIALDLAADGIEDAIGRVAQWLGFNIGNSDEVDEALDALNSIESSLATLESQISEDFTTLENDLANVEQAATLLEAYENLSQALEKPVAELDTRTLELIVLGRTNTITNEPRLPLVGFDTFATSLSNFNSETTLALIADLVLGQQQLGILEVYRRLISLQLGVTPTGSTVFAYTPFLSNSLFFDPYESVFQYYANAQILGLNLLVENANLALSPSIVADARVTIAKLRTNLALQSQAVGFPLPSDFLLSMPANAFKPRQYQPAPATPSATILYTQVMAPTAALNDQQAFLSLTQDFQAPGYPSGWRLPTTDELNFLYDVAIQRNPSDSKAGLQSLGFELPDNWDGYLWYLYSSGEASADVYVYNFNTGQPDNAIPSPGVEYGYIEVCSQGFDSSASYVELVAAGFRPTGPLSLQLAAGGTELQAFLNDENVTKYCAFSCSGPRQLELVETTQNSVTLVWHPGAGPLSAQTVTATLPGMNASDGTPKELRAALQVQVPSPPPTRTATSLLLTPSNTVLTEPGAQTVFKAIAFYDDKTIADVSQQVDWSLELPNGLPYPPGSATINGSIPGNLIFTQFPVSQPTVVIRATLAAEAVTGTTQLTVSEAAP